MLGLDPGPFHLHNPSKNLLKKDRTARHRANGQSWSLPLTWGSTPPPPYLVQPAGLEQLETLVLNPQHNVQVKQLLGVHTAFDGAAEDEQRGSDYHITPPAEELAASGGYLMFQRTRSRWKSEVAMIRSATGGEGPAGGHATRNARSLLQSSTL